MHVDHNMHLIGWNMHVTCTLFRIGSVVLALVSSLRVVVGLHCFPFQQNSKLVCY